MNMSNEYTMEYICEGCKDAEWHDCCASFCHCKAELEGKADLVNGECRYKERLA
jgi:hypothetical protein